MSYQQRPSWCAPAALQVALQIHGVALSQRKIAGVLGTDDFGTDSQDLIGGLDNLGAPWTEIETCNRNEARRWLLRWAPVAPLLLCVDSWEHWICIAGSCADRLWLIDSSPEHWNARALGRWPLTPERLLKRWRAARRCAADGGLYYGLAVLGVDAAKARQCARAATED